MRSGPTAEPCSGSAAKDVRTDRYVSGDGKRPIETLRELFVRNPWNNSAAEKFVALLDVQVRS
jgi:hypothetical protein